MKYKPIRHIGSIMMEGWQGSKREQRVNDALFLRNMASHFKNENMFYDEAIKLEEIANRLEKKKNIEFIL